VVEYRPFGNSDPPHLVRLWHDCRLGRGAAEGFRTDAFELVNFSQPYFDPQGLIIAWDGEQAVGFVHAGFGTDESEDRLVTQTGIICMLMVHGRFRRRGIGRALLEHAEEYLRRRGATQLQAGQSVRRDPFYFGLYGGARPAGFLKSDTAAEAFFTALGYESGPTIGVYQRNLTMGNDPIHFKLMAIRRSTQLIFADQPTSPSWWWFCHTGRLDSLRFRLAPKKGGPPIAGVSVVGLDAYIAKWNARAIGLVDVYVRNEDRGKGYGRALLVEVARHMRQELITLAEIHAPDENTIAVGAITGAGFERIDTGVVYVKPD
jgi:ribosomal protein S18 acetylase RimI-like enzyme